MATQGSAAPETGPSRQAAASARPGAGPGPKIVALQPGDTTESESDSAERLEQVDRLAPARGIAIGVIIAALFWGALAVLVFRLRR